MLNMNVENENTEPVTDLGLALRYSSQCVEGSLNSDLGEGANAGSMVDMTVVATDPLSELVWSPQNGLSLKFADSSFVTKKPALLWGAGPSIEVLSLSENFSAGRSSNEKPINEQNLIMSQDAFPMKNETAGGNTSGWNPGTDAPVMSDTGSDHEDGTGTGCHVDETNFVARVSEPINEKDEFGIGKGDCISGPSKTPMAETPEAKDKIPSSFPADLGPDLALNEPFSGPLRGYPTGEDKEVGSGNQTSGMKIDLASEIHRTEECEANDTIVRNLTIPRKRHEESASFFEKESKNKIIMTNSVSVHPLEKLEVISENDIDLPNLASKRICGAARKIVASESAHEVKNSRQLEGALHRDMAVSGEHSPTSCRIQRYRRKGKEKALSEGDVSERMLKEDDESYGSVESCNSTGSFSTGKRRWSFEQQLIKGSRNVKQKIHEIPGSTSYVKQDSSFMNWISNMMKGFSKSDKSPSLDLTLGHPICGHESSDRKLLSYKRKQDSGWKNGGFQSIFQSLYSSKTKAHERTSNDDYQKELKMVNGQCHIDATPLAFHADNDNLCKQFLLPNEKLNESTSGDGAGTATQLKISSANFGSSLENSKVNSAENKNSCNVMLGVAQVEGGTDSNSSSGKHKMSSTENVDSEPPLKMKKIHNLVHGSHPLGSLWITRIAPKNSFSLSNIGNQNQCKGQALDCSTSCPRFNPYSQSHNCSPNDLNIVETWPNPTENPPAVVGKELQYHAAEAETSSRFNKIKGHDDQKSICKPNPIIPYQRSQSSEAMASGFARRLDALRRIMSPDVTDNAGAATTCFFCGRKGHHLQNCSEITDGELKDLLRNINFYNGGEELPCLCIRCFQPNHWAVSCHNSSSRGQRLLEGNDFSPKEMQMYKKSHEGSGKKKWSENQTMRFCNFVDRHLSEVPKGVFDFVKGLRLSRTDILKWMNSHTSFAHLNGFFLRLRLGKWEEGHGGTGYYVACITGAERETGSKQASKNSISVNVGGIKCLVESQYISNHDFLEDELIAWWSATLKSGGKIPSEEDLRTKIEERKMLDL